MSADCVEFAIDPGRQRHEHIQGVSSATRPRSAATWLYFRERYFLAPPGISCIAVVMLLGYAAEGSSDWKASKSWSQWSLQSYGAPEDPEW